MFRPAGYVPFPFWDRDDHDTCIFTHEILKNSSLGEAMKSHHEFQEIFLCCQPVDFRMGIFSLSALCQAKLSQSPLIHSRLFVFTNKRRNSIKCLYWDKTGFALWQKIIEKEKFHWPKKNIYQVTLTITSTEFSWLLNGVNVWKIKTHKELHYSSIV